MAQMNLDDALAEAAAYKRDFEAELAGNMALRQKYGARENETMFDFIGRMVRERNEARAEVEQSYRRGAEAMREAAASEMSRLLTARKATAIWVGPDEIRSLPIPEEKS